MIKYTKKLIIVFAATMLVLGCTAIKYIPVKETEYVTIKDSVYFRDTTIQYQIEKEYVRDYTGLLDTLRLSTGLAEAESYIDTARNVLTGSIRNKEKLIDIPMSVKEKIVYKDSIVTKEVPVPVEVEKKVKFVPWYAKILSGFGIVFLILAALWAGKKFL